MASTARRHPAVESVGHSRVAMVMAFPAACFFGTLVTDIVYWQTAAGMWEDFSVWLLVAGLLSSVLAVLAVGIDLLANRHRGTARFSWPRALGNALAIILSIFNAFVHSRDGYTAVVPTGLTLSAIVVVILLFTGWMGQNMLRSRPIEGAS